MPPQPLASRVVTVTQGGLNNSYISLADLVNSEFFPPDSLGARNRRIREGRALRVWFAGLDGPVDCDIVGEDYKNLRSRSAQRQFFEVNGVRDGDQILIEKLGEREYRFSPLSAEKSSRDTRDNSSGRDKS